MYDSEKYTQFVAEELARRKGDEVVELIIALGTFAGVNAIPFLEKYADSTISFDISMKVEGAGLHDSYRSLVCVGDLAKSAIAAIRAEPKPGEGRHFETWAVVKAH